MSYTEVAGKATLSREEMVAPYQGISPALKALHSFMVRSFEDVDLVTMFPCQAGGFSSGCTLLCGLFMCGGFTVVV